MYLNRMPVLQRQPHPLPIIYKLNSSRVLQTDLIQATILTLGWRRQGLTWSLRIFGFGRESSQVTAYLDIP